MELSSIYNTAPVGLAVLDTRLRFQRINERLAAINGLSVEEHLGRTVAEVLPDLAPQAERVLRRILETGLPVRDVEIRGSTPADPDVERVWLEQFTPLKDESGAVVAISVVAEEITERRRLEHELRQSHAQLQQALEAARLVMWEWRIDQDVVEFGHGDWAGGSSAMPPRSMAEYRLLVHPEDRAHFDGCIEAHLSGRRASYECEYRVRTPGAGYRWALSKGRVAARGTSGEPLLMTGFRNDITTQKEAETDRREQAQLLELASDAIFVWNRSGTIERWNRGAERIYGYTAREAIGRVSHQLLDTEFPQPLPAILAHCEQHGIWRGELKHRCKDGRRLTVEAVMQPVEGQSSRVLEITRDVTAVREAFDRLAASERQLKANRERLDIALEAGRMGVWEWRPGSDVAWFSPQIFEFIEQPPATDGRASSASFLDLVDPEDRAGLDAQLARALDDAGDYEAQFRLHTPSGKTRWLLSRGRVLHSDEGSRLVGIHLDISGQKALEATLRESDARRNEFLAMLGHELRNPLAPITNAVRLLERQGFRDERQALAVQIVKRQSQHMARLVDDLLEVSRITQGRIELRMENVLVATAAYAAVETARPLARDKGQKIEVSVPGDLDVVADPARLTQILSNLVVNAVKYTPSGGHVRISARPSSERFVEVEVADDGTGISPELLPKIFELFTQDRRTLDRAEGGLGLGLALVRRLVELHGGVVECRSAGQGQGSTFTVCLPRHGRREELRANEAHPPARLAPTSILVVDDNRDAAETMASLLELDGHRVGMAFDGAQALEMAARERPHVVLLDIGLPVMSGLEVARRLREAPATANAVIIGMTGYAQADDRAASVAAGFDAHLAKPAEVADVYRAIEDSRR